VSQGSLTIVTPALLRAAQERGVAVQVWTVNDRAEMDRLFALGVDGVLTDRPDRALGALGRSYPAGVVPEFVPQ
jgi:glycerophosphoryl diester phosphodiesterase